MCCKKSCFDPGTSPASETKRLPLLFWQIAARQPRELPPNTSGSGPMRGARYGKCYPTATLQQGAVQIMSSRGEPGGLIGFIPSQVIATVQLKTATGTTDDLPWARLWDGIAHHLGATGAKLVQQGAS